MSRVLPEEPFLFYREPPDWRWLSFGDVGRRISERQQSLSGLEAGTGVGIPCSPSVEALVSDLSVRSLGLVSVPTPDDSGTSVVDDLRGASVVLKTTGVDASRPEGVVVVERRQLQDGEEPARDVRSSGPEGHGGGLGGCSLAPAGHGNPKRVVLTGAELEGAVGRLAEAAGKSERRPIAVHGRSLADPGERLVVEWVMREKGAVVVTSADERSRSAAIAEAAFWARPSILQGSAEELEEWTRILRSGESSRRGLRRRFRHLQSVVVTDGEDLDSGTRALYSDLGAVVLEGLMAEILAADRL